MNSGKYISSGGLWVNGCLMHANVAVNARAITKNIAHFVWNILSLTKTFGRHLNT